MKDIFSDFCLKHSQLMESIKKRGAPGYNLSIPRLFVKTYTKLTELVDEDMRVYTLKVVLRGVSPMIWRRIKIPGSTSLASLHYIIQTIYAWDDENLHQFHIYGKDYGINYEGGLGYSDNVHKVYLDDFLFDVGDKFSYEYNFFDHLMHDIRVENIEESTTTNESVRCIKGSGMPGVDKHDEIKIMAKLLKLIIDKQSSLSI